MTIALTLIKAAMTMAGPKGQWRGPVRQLTSAKNASNHKASGARKN